MEKKKNPPSETTENITQSTLVTEDGKEQISAAETSLLQKIIRKGLVETTKPLDIQRKNPNSPLYSIKSFEALHLLV
jgi:ATP-dependent RNA helicase DDX19/DBP5